MIEKPSGYIFNASELFEEILAPKITRRIDDQAHSLCSKEDRMVNQVNANAPVWTSSHVVRFWLKGALGAVA